MATMNGLATCPTSTTRGLRKWLACWPKRSRIRNAVCVYRAPRPTEGVDAFQQFRVPASLPADHLLRLLATAFRLGTLHLVDGHWLHILRLLESVLLLV